jgi:hypothetical protein
MESFYRSFFAPQTILLKNTLRPFCLGHLTLLQALENPFVSITGIIKPHDLIIAVKVCSACYPFEVDFKLTFYEKFMMFYMMRNQKLFIRNCQIFQNYLDAHHHCPEFWESDGASYSKNMLNSPTELSYVVNLMKQGISHSEAWSMSIGYMTWLNAAIQELNGIDKTFTDPLEDLGQDIEDLNNLTNEELYKVVLKDLGEIRAKEFMKRRQENGY